MTRSIGRPMKYRPILLQLENEDLYTPATIADHAKKSGYMKGLRREDERLARQRIRIALGRYSNNHGFPDEGDGFVTIAGQAPTPGWFGRRWKEALQREEEPHN